MPKIFYVSIEFLLYSGEFGKDFSVVAVSLCRLYMGFA